MHEAPKSSPSPLHLLVVSGVGLMFDSLDVGILAFVVVVLKSAWNLTSQQVGLLSSINLIGMAVGAAMAGMLADRFGRKAIFLWTLLVYSIATGLSALAVGFLSLIALRFIVGWGLGGELPVATTFVLESSPEPERARRVVWLESFWALGSLISALLSYFVIPSLGWRVAFLIGAVPALYVIILRWKLPESPQFNRIKAIRIKESAWQKFNDLWSRPNRTRTIALWILWFCIMFAYYGMFMWLPSIMVVKGFSVVKSFGYTLVMTLAQFPGYLSAAYLVETWGRKKVLVTYMFMSALFALLFGFAPNTTILLLAGLGLSFFNLGAFGAMYAYSVEQYPTANRGTGMGWAMGIGRIGGWIAPYMVGILVGRHFQIPTIFTIFFITTLFASIVGLIWGVETKGKTSETV